MYIGESASLSYIYGASPLQKLKSFNCIIIIMKKLPVFDGYKKLTSSVAYFMLHVHAKICNMHVTNLLQKTII